MEYILKPGQRSCPKCHANWDGGSILDTFIEQRNEGDEYWKGKTDEEIEAYVKESYAPPYRWGREIGIEWAWDDPKHRDEISAWQCPDCETIFDRWTGKEIIE